MKDTCNKGLLIPWLLKALNEQQYEGLQWSNRQKKIFYIVWTHKAAEHWSTDVLEPFKAWAAHKGKLAGKNEKQLKATFRCALNSKKDELREVYRNRCRRYWQFVDSDSKEGKSVNKKKRRPNSKHTRSPLDTSLDSVVNESAIADSATGDSFKQSEAKDSKKRRRRLNPKQAEDVTPSALHDNGSPTANALPSSSSGEETENSRIDRLPSFQTFYGFQPLTPPYEDNEIYYNATEYNSYNCTPEASRLTPPADDSRKNYYSSSDYNSFPHHLSSDVWQPNCWPITPNFQDFSTLNQLCNDFDQTVRSPSQEFQCNKMDYLEKDQSVPMTNMDDQTFYRNGQLNQQSKISFENNQCEQMTFDDEYLFTNNINTEDCEKLLQELKSIPSSPETGTYSYCS